MCLNGFGAGTGDSFPALRGRAVKGEGIGMVGNQGKHDFNLGVPGPDLGKLLQDRQVIDGDPAIQVQPSESQVDMGQFFGIFLGDAGGISRVAQEIFFLFVVHRDTS